MKKNAFIKKIFFFFLFFFSFQAHALLVSDSGIIAEIQRKIAENVITANLLAINITSKEGVVAIEGTVENDVQAGELIQIAASVPDMIDVDTSRLSVLESKNKFTDVIIVAKIKGAFIREELFDTKSPSEMGINVESIDGVVYITGAFENDEQLRKAATIAKSINGVREVQAKMRKIK